MFKVLNTCKLLNFELYTLNIESIFMYQQQWNMTVESQCFGMAMMKQSFKKVMFFRNSYNQIYVVLCRKLIYRFFEIGVFEGVIIGR